LCEFICYYKIYILGLFTSDSMKLSWEKEEEISFWGGTFLGGKNEL
jgi:6-phosphofructokinase